MSANLIQYCQRCEKKVAKFMIYRDIQYLSENFMYTHLSILLLLSKRSGSLRFAIVLEMDQWMQDHKVGMIST